MDLSAFGHRLRHLRKTAGLTQAALADQIGITTSLIWNWEKAYEYRGRRWIPDRDLVLHLIKTFAQQLAPGEAQQWAGQAGHPLNQADLQAIFPTHWAQAPVQLPPLPPFYVPRSEVEHSLLDQLEQNRTLVLVGPGGIGKTTLAISVARALASHFPDGVIWVENPASNSVIEAQNWIARSFGVTLNDYSLAERAAALRTLLHDRECLLVLDDVWADPELLHLQVVNDQSCLILTTRDAKVADLLNSPRQEISSLTSGEGLALLSAWVGHPIRAEELVARLGGLPLALSLSGAQLREGNVSLGELVTYFSRTQVDLSLLDLDDPQSRQESLNLCFDLSYRRLKAKEQQRFAQLACFAGSLEEAAVAAVWSVTPTETARILRRLRRFALLEQGERGYRLHPLLRDYARQQLAIQPKLAQNTFCRHASWYIRFALYHPAVLEDALNPAPNLDLTWDDVVAGVKWAANYQPQLVAQAILLAHTERPGLLEAVGADLIKAVENYLDSLNDQSEQAVICEILGDLYLLRENFEDGLNKFHQASEKWAADGRWLDSSRAKVRAGGAYLLCQNQIVAAEAARQGQALLAKALPIKSEEQITAKWLFYWFDILYNALVRWPELPETDVINLAELGKQTHNPLFMARGLHIHRLWCTVEDIPRSPEVRARGKNLAVQAYYLWRKCGRVDQADDEISYAQFQLDRRYSQRVAARYARRRSYSTPTINLAQIKLIKSKAIRWWLGATETQRVAWFSRMLPRYLGASNSSKAILQVGSPAWCWVKDIFTISVLGGEGRVLIGTSQPPANHILNGPEWVALSGRRVRPLANRKAIELVNNYLKTLDETLFKRSNG